MDENNNEQELQDMQTVQPILCPHCGSKNIEFITEYHKFIALRIFSIIVAAVFFFSLIAFLDFHRDTDKFNTAFYFMVASGILYCILLLFVWLGESKTHVQGICRDCGNIWLLN